LKKSRLRKPWPGRFWEKVSYGDPGGCWEWLGTKQPKGYGQIKMAGGRQVKAHRMAYQLAKPSMFDPALHVLHACDNPGCVRPGHLFQGTDLDNARDRDAKGQRDVRGERNGRAKLMPAQVLAIRNDLRPAWKIAKAYGISKTVARYVKTRKSWKHV
jgi:hypothetical protein